MTLGREESCIAGGFAGLLVGFFCGGFGLFFGPLIAYREGSRGGRTVSLRWEEHGECSINMYKVFYNGLYRLVGSMLHMFI